MKIFQKIFYVSLLITIVVLSSCEKDINVALPYAGDKIVVNAILTNDSLVYAHITKSAATENPLSSFEELQGCKAGLYENDIFKETLVEKIIKGKRYYTSSLRVKNNAKYTIKVAYQQLTSVQGEDIVPDKPFFEPIKYWQPSSNNSKNKLTIKLKDPAGQKNYYRLRIFPAIADVVSNTYGIYGSAYSISVDNFVKDAGIFGEFGDDMKNVIYFTDETFDGQEVTLTITVDVSSLSIATAFNAAAPELSSLSKAAYLYFDSNRKQDTNGENPFSEAVIVYNNIKNGFGIVGGVADRVSIISRKN